MNSIDTVKKGIKSISKKLGCEEKGKALMQRLTEELQKVKEAVEVQYLLPLTGLVWVGYLLSASVKRMLSQVMKLHPTY